jgi:hypothetical protein
MGLAQFPQDADLFLCRVSLGFHIFFYHHPVAPLFFLIATADNSTSNTQPHSVIPFALAVWAVISILFVLLACRGLRRTPAGRN